MIPGLEPVPLRELQALGTFRVWSVAGQLDEMPSLTPFEAPSGRNIAAIF